MKNLALAPEQEALRRPLVDFEHIRSDETLCEQVDERAAPTRQHLADFHFSSSSPTNSSFPPRVEADGERHKAMDTQRLIAVVDDDESVRESLPDLLRSFGFEVAAFASAEAFLASSALADADSLVLDIVMPGMSGPELYWELRRRGITIPVIFMTANSGGASRAELLGRGAAGYLVKPFDPDLLIDALRSALPSS